MYCHRSSRISPTATATVVQIICVVDVTSVRKRSSLSARPPRAFDPLTAPRTYGAALSTRIDPGCSRVKVGAPSAPIATPELSVEM